MRKFFQLIMPFFLVFLILITTQNVSGDLNTSSASKSSRQANELVIYTYESLLAWGNDSEAVADAVFTEFEQNEGIKIKLKYFSDVGEMLVTLVAEKDDPQADIAIGIDNSMIHHAKEEGIFTPFYPTNLDDIPKWLYDNLDTDHFINPYDYGLIALIYHKEALNETLLPDPDNFVLDHLLNETLASMFVTENPETSSTGLGFLLWTIAVYDKILGQDWTNWWRQIADKVSIKESWGDAWALWATEGSGKHIMVSYGTDAAFDYNQTQQTPSIGVLLSHEKGQPNGWLQIEGIGIVNDTAHQEKAEKFVDWFLSKTVQKYIPENNWMFPANQHTELPDSFQYAVNLTGVNILNDLISPEELQEYLGTWLNAWSEAIYISGFDAISVIFVFSFLGAIILVVTRRNKKETFK